MEVVHGAAADARLRRRVSSVLYLSREVAFSVSGGPVFQLVPCRTDEMVM